MKKIYFLLLYTIMSYSQTQIGLDINGEVAGDLSGYSVSLSTDGDILAIGGISNNGNGTNSGHVRVYRNVSGTWTQIGSDINGEAAGDECGYSVSLSSDGNIVAIGAPFNDGNGTNSGHVRIFQNVSNVWTQIGLDINGEAAGDESGKSVSLSSNGTIVAIGAIGNDGNGSNSGHVRVYRNVSNIWTQIGTDINGEASGDVSGYTISLSSDGNIIAIGAPENDENGSNSGHVRIYQNVSEVWTQIGSDINGEVISDQSGESVSLSSDGNIVAIGAIFNDGNSSNSGHVRVFQNASGVWTQIGSDINGEALGDLSGESVSLSSDGNIVAIGAIFNDGSGTSSGHVRIFQNVSGNWIQVGSDINGEALGDESGENVSLSSDGSIVAIGAPQNDGTGSGSGHVRVYNLSSVLRSDNIILSQFSIHPNPTSNIVTITLQNDLELISINIYNALGQFIKSEKNSTIDVRNLSKGNYFFEVNTNKGKATKAIIIE
jgi:Flp pilus assembly pilin Flp